MKDQLAAEPDNSGMSHALLLLPVLLPVLFWAAYHYHKDRHLPEPVPRLAQAFALGLLSAGISKALYVALGWASLRYDALALAHGNLPGLFAYAMLAIGPVEELAKLLPFLLLLKIPEFDEPIDGIIYASFVALGYAAVENVMYLQYLAPAEAMARGFGGPVVHMAFASIWGYTIGCAHLRGEPLLPGLLRGFLLAAGLHGVYDFFVLQQTLNALPIAASLIVGVWIWRLQLLRGLQERSSRRGAGTNRDCKD